MALSKYKNINEINSRDTGTGQFLEKEDLFVLSQDNKEVISFPDCDNDVMEVVLYDVNNNILPQPNGDNIKYIKGIYNISQYIIKTNTNEIGINVEKIINDSGYKNGIIKVNINFVRLKAGDETTYRKLRIQEISPSRTEIRILPLDVQNNNSITQQNKRDFNVLQNLEVDSLQYKNHLNEVLNTPNNLITQRIKTYIDNKFSEVSNPYTTFIGTLQKDFGISPTPDTAQPAFNTLITNVRNKFFEDIDVIKNSLAGTLCNYVTGSVLDNQIFQKLQNSLNFYANSLQTFGPEFVNITSDSLESIQEQAFETGLSVNTTAISQDIDEYTTVSLSNIKLNSTNLDDFPTLQTQLREQLISQEIKVAREEPTIQEPTIREPTPVYDTSTSGGGGVYVPNYVDLDGRIETVDASITDFTRNIQ